MRILTKTEKVILAEARRIERRLEAKRLNEWGGYGYASRDGRSSRYGHSDWGANDEYPLQHQSISHNQVLEIMVLLEDYWGLDAGVSSDGRSIEREVTTTEEHLDALDLPPRTSIDGDRVTLLGKSLEFVIEAAVDEDKYWMFRNRSGKPD